MAVFQSIRNFFTSLETAQPEVIVPAPPTTYELRPLTLREIDAVLRLNNRCFRNGENYTRHTFSYLLNEPATVSCQAVTADGAMAGFENVRSNFKPLPEAFVTLVFLAGRRIAATDALRARRGGWNLSGVGMAVDNL